MERKKSEVEAFDVGIIGGVNVVKLFIVVLFGQHVSS